MNTYQFISIFISMSYIFYSLWGRFYDDERYYNKLLVSKTLQINIVLAILFAVFGVIVDLVIFKITVQTSIYFMPICFIGLLHFFNKLCFLINKRQFHSIRSSVDMNLERKDFIDLLFTMILMFLSFTLPLMIFNLIINNKLFN
jgi:hypothetical protein